MAKKSGKATAKPKPPAGRWQRLRYKHPVRLPSAWFITKASARLLWQHRKLFLGITIVYGLLNLVLVQGLANTSDIGNLKSDLNQTFSGHFGSLGTSLSVFTALIGSAGNGSSNTAGAYQLFLGLITSLAVIWALRQLFNGTTVRIRDAYYRGMYPLVPFILVLLVIGLEFLPFLIGSTLYSLVISNSIAIHAAERFLWLMLFVVLALVSLYMVSSSVFALYIVTLPDMTPIKALRSAKQLVQFRRWTVLRKMLFLPLVLLVVAAVVMVPIIVWLTSLAQWVFFLLTMLALAAVHTYLYSLYRELLNE